MIFISIAFYVFNCSPSFCLIISLCECIIALHALFHFTCVFQFFPVLNMQFCDDLWSVFGYAGSSFSWICGGELALGSYCTQRTIINGVNLLFLSVFLLFTLISTIRKHYITVPARRDQFSLAISICCALTSIAYFAAGLWDLISESDDQSEHFVRLDYFARGLIWISFTASLLVQSSKWIQNLELCLVVLLLFIGLGSKHRNTCKNS